MLIVTAMSKNGVLTDKILLAKDKGLSGIKNPGFTLFYIPIPVICGYLVCTMVAAVVVLDDRKNFFKRPQQAVNG
jgi:hypothetical protein